MLSRWTLRGLALAGGGVLTLALSEGWLRTFGYAGEHARIKSVFDARFGRVPRDSWVFDMSVEPPAAILGGQEVPIPKPENETRVLFLGDSGTEGAYVSTEESFPMRFGETMRDTRPELNLRAINAGVFGMTTLDELKLLGRLVPLEPDVVVLGLFRSNDINFNLGHPERRRPSPSEAWPWLVDRSALAHFLQLRLMAWGLRSSLARRYAFAWIPREMQLVDRYGFHMLSYPAGEVALYMKEPSPLVDRAYGVLERALRHFLSLSYFHGFRFVVLLIPSPSAVAGSLRLLHYPEIYDDLAKGGIELREEQLDVDLPRERVAALCAELDIQCIDPTERMRSAGMEVFFPTDEHPTALGHRILADALVERAAGFIE